MFFVVVGCRSVNDDDSAVLEGAWWDVGRGDDLWLLEKMGATFLLDVKTVPELYVSLASECAMPAVLVKSLVVISFEFRRVITVYCCKT